MIASVARRLRAWLAPLAGLEDRASAEAEVREAVAPAQAAVPVPQIPLTRAVAATAVTPTAVTPTAITPIVVTPPVVMPVVASVVETTAAGKKGRPVSDALSRTLQMLSEKPDISGAEVAKKLKVSQSYARTLLRRAKARRETLETAAPKPAVAIDRPSPVALVEKTPSPAPDNSALLARLERAEGEITRLRENRPAPRGRWDLSRRAEVLRRNALGESPEAIAAGLSIPRGEVSFILKVNQVLLAR